MREREERGIMENNMEYCSGHGIRDDEGSSYIATEKESFFGCKDNLGQGQKLQVIKA